MPVRLEWQVGDDDIEIVDAADLSAARSRPPVGSWLRRIVAIGLYLALLAVAAWLGFYLGRVTDVRSAHRDAIQATLAVERLAWHDGDASLYQTTLSPSAWPDDLATAVARFEDASPADVELRVVSITRLAPDRSCVEVEFRSAARSRLEQREYLLTESTWRRTLAGCPEP